MLSYSSGLNNKQPKASAMAVYKWVARGQVHSPPVELLKFEETSAAMRGDPEPSQTEMFGRCKDCSSRS
jgi:hypothetical protein